MSWLLHSPERLKGHATKSIPALNGTLDLSLVARTLPGKELLAFFGFAILTSLYLLPFMRFVSIGADEGTLLYGAVRIYRGQIFARDFFEVMGPGTFYWLAAFFKLFGVTFFAARLCLFVTSLGTALCLYWLTRRVCPERSLLPCTILAATYFGAAWPGISHHVDSTFFALSTIVCTVMWRDQCHRGWLLLAGVMAGATALIHLPKGVFLLCAIALWLAIDNRGWRAWLSAFGVIVLGVLTIAVPFALYFWHKDALQPLVYANFTFPSTQYAGVNNVAYAQGLRSNYWDYWLLIMGTSKYAITIASIMAVPFLFIAASPVLFIALSFRFWRLWAVHDLLLYWLAGSALWLSEFHRRDIYHLVFGSPILIVLCISLVSRLARETSELAFFRHAFFRLVFFGLAFCSCCLICANLFVVMAAQPFQTRVGRIRVLRPDPIVVFLDEHAQPGSSIFVYPYCPTYYFLTATVNPTPYSFLLYRYNTVEQFRDTVRILEDDRPRYVVWDTNFNGKAAAEAFPGSQDINRNDLIVEPYLESRYAEVKRFDGVLILERKKNDFARDITGPRRSDFEVKAEDHR